jgi:hypothetical protein
VSTATSAPLVLILMARPAAAWAGATVGIAKDTVAGGDHWRLQTPRGPVHVWRPAGFDRRSAGTVVYVHGYSANADAAWEQHDLATQFKSSRRNAVFLVPEAPASLEDAVRWPSLNELLNAVRARLGSASPPGPLVVMGHSAAHRTLVPWLKNPHVEHVILLDAIYSEDTVEALRTWARTGRGRLTVVAADTARDAERLIEAFPSAVRRGVIPESDAGFTSGERRARITYFLSQYGHLAMVTEGKAIAPLLGLTRLMRLAPPPRPRAPAHPRH